MLVVTEIAVLDVIPSTESCSQDAMSISPVDLVHCSEFTSNVNRSPQILLQGGIFTAFFIIPRGQALEIPNVCMGFIPTIVRVLDQSPVQISRRCAIYIAWKRLRRHLLGRERTGFGNALTVFFCDILSNACLWTSNYNMGNQTQLFEIICTIPCLFTLPCCSWF